MWPQHYVSMLRCDMCVCVFSCSGSIFLPCLEELPVAIVRPPVGGGRFLVLAGASSWLPGG